MVSISHAFAVTAKMAVPSSLTAAQVIAFLVTVIAQRATCIMNFFMFNSPDEWVSGGKDYRARSGSGKPDAANY